MKKYAETIKVAMIPFLERQQVGRVGEIQYQAALPVRLRAQRFVLERHGLIDTGSYMCLINRETLEKEASADLAQQLLTWQGLKGTQFMPCYKFDIDICNAEFQTVLTLKGVNFAAAELPSGIDIVLGRQGFLENMRLTIDYPEREVEVDLPSQKSIRAKPSYLTQAKSLVESFNYRAAVVEISGIVERLLHDTAQYSGMPTKHSTITLAEAIKSQPIQKLVGSKLLEPLSEFAQLRNVAVHGSGPMTRADAQRALELGEQIITLLDDKLKQLKSSFRYFADIILPETYIAIEYIDHLNKSTHMKRRNLFVQAMTYREKGLYSEAADYLMKALATRAHGSERIALLVLLGATQLKLGMLPEAIHAYTTAIQDAAEVQDRFGLTAALGNLGIANEVAGNLMESQEYLQAAIALSEQIGFVTAKANLLVHLAKVNKYLGRNHAANVYGHEAVVLAKSLEDRSPYTKGHSPRVAETARKIANELRLSPKEMMTIEQAALLHDIGMIAIPDGVLYKKSKLTPSQFEMIKSHPTLGAKIVQNFKRFPSAISIVQYHHEHYDGTGYPEGLKGDDIPIGAQILAVADAYDAMTSRRPYRRALTQEEATKELTLGTGSIWNPRVIKAFMNILTASTAGEVHG